MAMAALFAQVVPQVHTVWSHHGPWLLAPLFFFWLWIGAAALGIYLIRTHLARGYRVSERAQDILAERFAAGEISAEEYHDRLAQLR
jgi:uncharacterized membrane protein